MLLRDLPGPVFYAAAGAIGLAWSMVVTTAVERLPRRIPLLRPAPSCPSCEAPLRGLDLVPIVSFFAFRGRAPCCGAARGVGRLLLEIGSLLLAVTLVPVTLQTLDPWAPLHHAAFVYLATTALALALLTGAVIDARHGYIPDAITLGGAFLGVSTSVLRGMALTDSLAGASICFFVTAIPLVYVPRILPCGSRLRRRPGLGLGDVKLLILAGAWLGTRAALLALGLAAVQGILVFGAAKALGRKIEIPRDVAADVGPRPVLVFGPFIVLGILERMFLGPRLDAIVTWRAPW